MQDASVSGPKGPSGVTPKSTSSAGQSLNHGMATHQNEMYVAARKLGEGLYYYANQVVSYFTPAAPKKPLSEMIQKPLIANFQKKMSHAKSKTPEVIAKEFDEAVEKLPPAIKESEHALRTMVNGYYNVLLEVFRRDPKKREQVESFIRAPIVSLAKIRIAVNMFKSKMLLSSWSFHSRGGFPRYPYNYKLVQRGVQVRPTEITQPIIQPGETDPKKITHAASEGDPLASCYLAEKYFTDAKQSANPTEQADHLVSSALFLTQACLQEDALYKVDNFLQRGAPADAHLCAFRLLNSDYFRDSQAYPETLRHARIVFHAVAINARLTAEQFAALPKADQRALHVVLEKSERGEYDFPLAMSLRTDLPAEYAIYHRDVYTAFAALMSGSEKAFADFFEKNPHALSNIVSQARRREVKALQVLAARAHMQNDFSNAMLYIAEILELEPDHLEWARSLLTIASRATANIQGWSWNTWEVFHEPLIHAMEIVNARCRLSSMPDTPTFCDEIDAEIERVRGYIPKPSETHSRLEL